MFVCKCSGVGSTNGYVSGDYKKFFHWLFHLLMMMMMMIKKDELFERGKKVNGRINRIRFQCLVGTTVWIYQKDDRARINCTKDYLITSTFLMKFINKATFLPLLEHFINICVDLSQSKNGGSGSSSCTSDNLITSILLVKFVNKLTFLSQHFNTICVDLSQ